MPEADISQEARRNYEAYKKNPGMVNFRNLLEGLIDRDAKLELVQTETGIRLVKIEMPKDYCFERSYFF